MGDFGSGLASAPERLGTGGLAGVSVWLRHGGRRDEASEDWRGLAFG